MIVDIVTQKQSPVAFLAMINVKVTKHALQNVLIAISILSGVKNHLLLVLIVVLAILQRDALA